MAETVGAQSRYPKVAPSPTLTDRTAQHILDDIVERGLRAGDRLPSERELGEAFGVSRTVIREAVRSLVARGIIETRPGVGLRVAASDPARVSEALSLYLQGTGSLPYARVHEIRVMLEVQVAKVACTYASAEDLQQVLDVHRKMGEHLHDPQTAAELDVQFHRQIAVATENPLYTVMLDSVSNVMLNVRKVAIGLEGRPQRAFGFHEQIMNALLDRDPVRAGHAMQAHLDDVQQVWEELQRNDSSLSAIGARGPRLARDVHRSPS